MAIKFAINGFGRIGRNVVRAAVKEGCFGKEVELTAVNDLGDAETLAFLLKHDSVHGPFPGEVQTDGNSLVINGKKVEVLGERDPSKLPWQAHGVQVALESTGIFTKRELAAKHISAGASKVIISAPAKDADVTLVYGVNHDRFNPSEHQVISNGSCTTNCLAPVARVLLDSFGIESGLMTTIHSYTNDQKILDLPHKDLRRARAAALSMIPTSTGAAKALSLVIPELEGKLDGMAVRVPTPNVSMVDLVARLEKETSVEELNEALTKAATGPLKGVLAVSQDPLVSSDFNGAAASSTVDLLSTMVKGRLVKVISWYDNEMGFSHRMVDVLKLVAK